MPKIKVLVEPFTSETVIGQIVALANTNTPANVVPSATVNRDASGKVVSVDVNLPTSLSKADLVIATNAINANKGVSRATPSGAPDTGTLEALPLGTAPATIDTIYGPWLTTQGYADFTWKVVNAAAEVLAGNGLSTRFGSKTISDGGDRGNFDADIALFMDLSLQNYRYGSAELWAKKAPSTDGVTPTAGVTYFNRSWNIDLGNAQVLVYQNSNAKSMLLFNSQAYLEIAVPALDVAAGFKMKLVVNSIDTSAYLWESGAWALKGTIPTAPETISYVNVNASIRTDLDIGLIGALASTYVVPSCVDSLSINLTDPV